MKKKKTTSRPPENLGSRTPPPRRSVPWALRPFLPLDDPRNLSQAKSGTFKNKGKVKNLGNQATTLGP